MNLFEPFSTHKPWDDLTTEAYHAMPLDHKGWHYQIGDHCTPAQLAEWKAWMRKYPDHWPGHVRQFVDRKKAKA